MGTQYVGEVRLVPYNFAPIDWSFCNGATIAISENTTLYNLIGTTYGGNGQSTFQLPNLQGRIPIHQGSNGTTTYLIGQSAGLETVTVAINQFPAHTHSLMASTNAGSSSAPANNTVGGNPTGVGLNAYTADAPSTAMYSAMVGNSNGGNVPHNNLQPFLVMNWIIALYGVYPSQS
jgi:microcystin-dependent protein